MLPFKPTRFMVWSRCAPNFAIHAFKLGNCAVDASFSTVPADAFATKLDMLPLITAALEKDGCVEIRVPKNIDALGLPLVLPTVQVGMDITIEVENLSDEPQRFLAIMMGKIPRY